jgi:hypothetical protein
MNRKEIHFVIDRQGNIQSTIKGIKGAACRSISKEFRELGQVIEQQPTDEFYQIWNGSELQLDLKQKN